MYIRGTFSRGLEKLPLQTWETCFPTHPWWQPQKDVDIRHSTSHFRSFDYKKILKFCWLSCTRGKHRLVGPSKCVYARVCVCVDER